jgi:hypothetical protein
MNRAKRGVLMLTETAGFSLIFYGRRNAFAKEYRGRISSKSNKGMTKKEAEDGR